MKRASPLMETLGCMELSVGAWPLLSRLTSCVVPV